MNIMVHGVPVTASRRQIVEFFTPTLYKCGAESFFVDKRRDNPAEIWVNNNGERKEVMRAIITLTNARIAKVFCEEYDYKLLWEGLSLRIVETTQKPSPFLLLGLESKATQSRNAPMDDDEEMVFSSPTNFDILTFQCGDWAYTDDPAGEHQEDHKLVYVPYFSDPREGKMMLGKEKAVFLLGQPDEDRCRIDIAYKDCKHIVVGDLEDPVITFNLAFAPSVFLAKHNPHSNKKRLPAIDEMHAKVIGSCFVYRIRLAQDMLFDTMAESLRLNVQGSSILSLKIASSDPKESWADSFASLQEQLLSESNFGEHHFKVCYQLLRLAQNGILPPQQVAELIPHVNQLLGTQESSSVLLAIAKVDGTVKVRGPGTKAEEVDVAALKKAMDALVQTYNKHRPRNPYSVTSRNEGYVLVHLCIITPAGVYLRGPEPCHSNRFLRLYEDHLDSILRVKFQDEDGGSIAYRNFTNLKAIHENRFAQILRLGLPILDQYFSFLGYANSAVRSQFCWFMAPIARNQRWHDADAILRELGDFSNIRAPGKCASRIGQSFSDSTPTIDIDDSMIRNMPDVVRNGYTFSDGIGSISRALLDRVWETYEDKAYKSKHLAKPTALQIRFKGVRGMVALDSRLEGECLAIRPSMDKFHTNVCRNLEVCSAAVNASPMHLNGALIQVLSDLGVPDSAFESLQQEAVDKLRQAHRSPGHADKILPEFSMCNAGKFQSLLGHLDEVGLDYRRDRFLLAVVDLSILGSLLQIKHRNRILVEKSAVLYGIMDETGVLAPDEIFVVRDDWQPDGQRVLLGDRVAVCRSPVQHPGDVQVVRAVQVPEDSPLRALSNVVVFSQHGDRDLPSQLGGGDLDGDHFHVFWEERLVPPRTHPAAAYPQEEAASLDRPVTRQDITDLFVKVMGSDLISMVSSRRLQYADQAARGTEDPVSIELARLASTAVDTPKTGNFIQPYQVPKADRCRPDFMGPTPQIVISDEGFVQLESPGNDGDDVALEGIEMEHQPPGLVYPSKKILGKLFRAIDELKFIKDAMSRGTRAQDGIPAATGLITKIFYLVQDLAVRHKLEYQKHTDMAQALRVSYEEDLVKMLYQLAPSTDNPLKEIEAFAGMASITRNALKTSELKELNMEARRRLGVLVGWTMECLRLGIPFDGIPSGNEEEIDPVNWPTLSRAIAGLAVTLRQEGHKDPKLGHLISFRYIAASVCLQELEKFIKATFGKSATLPKIPAWMSGHMP